MMNLRCCSCNCIEFLCQNSDEMIWLFLRLSSSVFVANLSNLVSVEIMYGCKGISAYAPIMIHSCLHTEVFEEVLEIVSYMTFFSPKISLDMWSLWPLMMEALSDWAIDFFSSKLRSNHISHHGFIFSYALYCIYLRMKYHSFYSSVCF